MSNQKMPSFFYDQENKETGDLEVFIQYFISWTLRCANTDDSLLSQYSQQILFKLLELVGIETKSDYKIKEVKTWKEWNKIDLCVEIILEKDGKKEKYAIAIEIKMYTTLRENQLQYYKKIFDAYYDKPDSGYELRYVYLSGNEEISEEDKKQCNLSGFTPLYVCDIKKAFGENLQFTGNALFDAFWFDYFKCGY